MLVEAHFSGKSILPYFCGDERPKFANIPNTALVYNPYFFLVWNSYPTGCDIL